MAEERFALEMGPGDIRNVTAAQVRQIGNPVRGNPDAFSDAYGNVFDLSLSPTVSAPTGSWGPADVWVPNAAAAPAPVGPAPVGPAPVGPAPVGIAAIAPEAVAVPTLAPTGVDLSIQQQMNLHPHLRLPTWVEPELRGWGGQEVYREGEFKGLTPQQARQRAVAQYAAGNLPAPGVGIGALSSMGAVPSGGGNEGQAMYSYPGDEGKPSYWSALDKMFDLLATKDFNNLTPQDAREVVAAGRKENPSNFPSWQGLMESLEGRQFGALAAQLGLPSALSFAARAAGIFDMPTREQLEAIHTVYDVPPDFPGQKAAIDKAFEDFSSAFSGMGQAGLGSYSSSFGVTGGTDPSGLGSYGEGTEGYYASGGLVSLYASGGDLSQIPTESDIDTAYNRYIENLEKSASDLSDDEVMTDVMDSFVASKGLDPQSLVMPPPEKRRDLYKTLELAPPPASEATLDTGSLSWYRDHGLLAPPMAYEEFLRRRYNLEVPELLTGQRFEPDPGSGSTDKYLPAVIDIAGDVAGAGVDEPRPKATGKGQMFRGIGSLMRRRIFPLVQAVLFGYEHLLTDEQKSEVEDFLSRPVHEAVGMEKSGLEYVRDYLGLEGSEPEGEAIALPAPELPMDEASRMARAKEMGFDVDDPQFKGMYPYDWTKEVGDYKGPEITEINRTTEFPAFNKGEAGVDLSGFTASSPEVANRFAGPEGAVYPLLIKRGRELVIDAKGGFAADVQFGESGKAFREAVKSGDYDSIRIINTKDEGDITAMITPENIRSRFAKFDPAKKGSADIGHAAGGFVAKPLYDNARII
jgi:hypothetical protein